MEALAATDSTERRGGGNWPLDGLEEEMLCPSVTHGRLNDGRTMPQRVRQC